MNSKDIAILHEKYNTHEFVQMRGYDFICKQCGKVNVFYKYEELTKKIIKELNINKTEYYNLIYNNPNNDPYIKFHCIMENNIKIEDIDKGLFEKLSEHHKNLILMKNKVYPQSENIDVDSFLLTIIFSQEYDIDYDILIRFIKDNIYVLKDFSIMYPTVLKTIIKYNKEQRKELIDLIINNRKLSGELKLEENNKNEILEVLKQIKIKKIKF